MPARPWIATLLTLVAVVGLMPCNPAAAATAGGVSGAVLTGFNFAASTGAPAVVAWENFNGADGTNINGTTTDDGAKTWAVNPTGGSWTILTNAARSTSANTSLVIDGGSANGSAVVTLNRNGATTFDAGLTINRNAAGTQFLTAEWTSNSSGSVELWSFNGGWTNLASVTNLYPGGIGTAPASITLTLTSSSANVVTAFINGTSVVSTTLSAANITTFKNATHQLAGPYQWTSNGIGWDNFHFDNP